MKTFGTLRFSAQKKDWAVTAEPHVILRLKRVFGQLHAQYREEFRLTDTADTARDLEWFLTRYPLEISKKDAAYLTERATFARDNELLVHQLASGIATPRPFELALPPRGYQKVAAEIALQRKSLLLGDDMGSGKTVSAFCMLTEPTTRPALVVTMTSLTVQWQDELRKFAPSLSTHILKTSAPYDLTGSKPGQLSLPGMFPDVIITSYTKLAGWVEYLAPIVKSVVYDEIQDLRRGTETNKGRAAKRISECVLYRLGLSGTPVYNLGGEIWHVMQMLEPDLLGTWNEFITEHCGVVDQRGRAGLSNPKAFGSYLRGTGALLRRTRKDLGTELPPCTKVVHEIDCDEAVLKRIEGDAMRLAEIILAQTQQRRGEKMQAAEEFDMLVRQATGIAKAPYVADFVRMLIESNEEPVVVYGWHRDVYAILLEKLSDLKPLLYTGTESVAQKVKAKKAFLAGETKLLIMSLRSGVGLDGLQSVCSTIVYAELDYSAGAMAQSLTRIDRDGQKNPVFAYYPIANSGSDPPMVDMLNIKRIQVEGIQNPTEDPEEFVEADGQRIRKLAEYYTRKKSK
jgi:SNF2 family DNA or RNA helicase